jgi:hypothetical protein
MVISLLQRTFPFKETATTHQKNAHRRLANREGEKFFRTALVVWFVSWDPICEGTLGAPPNMWANLTLIKLFVKFSFKNKYPIFLSNFLQILKILCFSLCFFLPFNESCNIFLEKSSYCLICAHEKIKNSWWRRVIIILSLFLKYTTQTTLTLWKCNLYQLLVN